MNLIELNKFYTNKRYINSADIDASFQETAAQLTKMNAEDLVATIKAMDSINLYRDEFTDEWIIAATNKINDFSPHSLIETLSSLHTLKHNTNLDFLDSVNNRLTSCADSFSAEECVDSIWLLNKFEYKDDDFLRKWSDQTTKQIDNISLSSITKLTQGIAKLGFYDEILCNKLTSKIADNINSFNQRELVNTAFYLTMIKTNNELSDDQLSATLIKELLNKVNYKKIAKVEEKHQILQINAAGINCIDDIPKALWNSEVKESAEATAHSSFTQQEISSKLKSRFEKFCDINEEVWQRDMAALVDIHVKYKKENLSELLIQVDGPQHWYKNQIRYLTAQNINDIEPNATTKFNSELARKNNILIERINFIEAENPQSYLYSIDLKLSIANAAIVQSRESSSEQKSQVTTTHTAEKAKPQNNKMNPSARESGKKTTQQGNKEPSKDDDMAYLDRIIAENNKLFPERRAREKYKDANDDMGKIRLAINAQDFDSATAILEDNEKINQSIVKNKQKGNNNSSKNSSNETKSLFDEALSSVNIQNEASLNFSNYLIQKGATFNASNAHHSSLVYIIQTLKTAIYKDDALMVNNLLKLIPEGKNKKIITELTFIEYCNKEKNITNLFIENGINLNCAHTIQSLRGWIYYISQNASSHNSNQTNFEDKLAKFLFREPNNKNELITMINLNTFNIEQRTVTALHIASDYGNKATVELLLKNGANPNASQIAETNPFYSAIVARNTEIAELLFKHGANANIIDDKGQSALLLAANLMVVNHNQKSLIDLMLKSKKVNLDYQTANNETALSLSVMSKKYDIATKLIEYGADPLLPKNDFTPLDYAYLQGNAAIYEQLVVASASTEFLQRRSIQEYSYPDDELTRITIDFEKNPLEYIKNSKVSTPIKLLSLNKLLERCKGDKTKEDEINQVKDNILTQEENRKSPTHGLENLGRMSFVRSTSSTPGHSTSPKTR